MTIATKISSFTTRLEHLSRPRIKRIRQRLVRPFNGDAPKLNLFVAGAQRSGTNMVMDLLERSAQTEVFHERDPRAFDNYELRSDDVIESLARRSPAPKVVFKALCESQDVGRLIQRFAPAQAIWVYRDYEATVRSHVRKWTGMPSTMRIIVEEGGTDGWRGRGMSAETREFIEGCYHDDLNNESACALFWYMRNVLFFEQALEQDSRCRLVSYNRLMTETKASARDIFDFAGLRFHPGYCRFVTPDRAATRETDALPIDSRIREACDNLLLRLEASLVPLRGD
ncbi:sulfotransferase domain-containing protein [Salinisphaera orenii]|nr:sulfotransferase domain-containing protein [Salinisphaera halophila]